MQRIEGLTTLLDPSYEVLNVCGVKRFKVSDSLWLRLASNRRATHAEKAYDSSAAPPAPVACGVRTRHAGSGRPRWATPTPMPTSLPPSLPPSPQTHLKMPSLPLSLPSSPPTHLPKENLEGINRESEGNPQEHTRETRENPKVIWRDSKLI